jgi:hypothetical protein
MTEMVCRKHLFEAIGCYHGRLRHKARTKSSITDLLSAHMGTVNILPQHALHRRLLTSKSNLECVARNVLRNDRTAFMLLRSSDMTSTEAPAGAPARRSNTASDPR